MHGEVHASRRTHALPSHFVARLCGTKWGTSHHGDLDRAVLLVHDEVQLLFQGLAGGFKREQFCFDAIQAQADRLVNGIQERLERKRRPNKVSRFF